MFITYHTKQFEVNSKILWTAFLLFCLSVVLLIFYTDRPQKQNLDGEVSAIASSVRAHFQKKPDYRGLNTAYAVQNKIVESKHLRLNKIYSQNSREILIGADSQGSTCAVRARSFAVTYVDVSKEECAELLAQKFDISSGLTAFGLEQYTFTFGGALPFPQTPKEAQKYCANKNTISFVFE